MNSSILAAFQTRDHLNYCLKSRIDKSCRILRPRDIDRSIASPPGPWRVNKYTRIEINLGVLKRAKINHIKFETRNLKRVLFYNCIKESIMNTGVDEAAQWSVVVAMDYGPQQIFYVVFMQTCSSYGRCYVPVINYQLGGAQRVHEPVCKRLSGFASNSVLFCAQSAPKKNGTTRSSQNNDTAYLGAHLAPRGFYVCWYKFGRIRREDSLSFWRNRNTNVLNMGANSIII